MKENSKKDAVTLLNCFTLENPELGLSDVCTLSGYPKSTALRYLKILEREGYLAQNEITKKYSLGYRVYRLFSIVANTKSLHKVALPYMQDLRDLNNETVSLYELVGNDHCVRIERLLTNDQIHHNPMIGILRPLYGGASASKVILAYMAEEKIKEVFRQGIEDAGEMAKTDPQKFLNELHEIRKSGYAVSNSIRRPGIKSIAVPIWTNGIVQASLSIAGSEFRITNKDIDRSIVKQLKLASRNISIELGSTIPFDSDMDPWTVPSSFAEV